MSKVMRKIAKAVVAAFRAELGGRSGKRFGKSGSRSGRRTGLNPWPRCEACHRRAPGMCDRGGVCGSCCPGHKPPPSGSGAPEDDEAQAPAGTEAPDTEMGGTDDEH